MSALEEGKAILSQDAGPWLEESRMASLKLQQTQGALIPAYTLDWQRHKSEETPQRMGLLTGHPRSGTTLLEQALDAHPGVVSAEETPLLGGVVHDQIALRHDPQTPVTEMLDRLEPDDLIRLRKAYWTEVENSLPDSLGDRMLLDKNPDA